jgi:hypothetical protein
MFTNKFGGSGSQFVENASVLKLTHFLPKDGSSSTCLEVVVVK